MQYKKESSPRLELNLNVTCIIILHCFHYFLVFFIGIYVSLVAEGVFKDKSNSEKGEILSYTASIAFLNSLLDPIIYAFQISSVKQRFRRVFCCNTKNLSNIQAEGYITDVSSIKIRN